MTTRARSSSSRSSARTQVGEVVSIKYVGDGETSTGNSYPKFSVSRKPPVVKPQKEGDDDVPF